MPRLNVRCCCQPQKILGTMEVSSLYPVQRIPVMRLSSYINPQIPAPADFTIEYHTIELKRIFGGDIIEEEMAIYSDDRPIEFWRQFRGFKENHETTDP